jgi:hypothetical protein
MRNVLPLGLVVLVLCAGLRADSFKETVAKAEGGNADAQYQLGNMYERGTGVERSIESALEWYKQAATHGHSQSMQRLAVLYYNGDALGNTIKADPEQAWFWFTFAAIYGQTQASADATRVAGELRKSNLPDLRMRVAKALIEGDIVPAKIDKGVELYRAAAEEGSIDAAELLAALYTEGTRVPRDSAKAVAWYEKAANAGSLRAMFALAKIAESASPRDSARAAAWYEKAAKAGSLPAMFALAQLAESESPPNPQRVFELYRKAALRSDGKSMYRLGELYAQGVGVPRDPFLAYCWFVVAGDFDLREGKAAARDLEVNLTDDQLKKARLEISKIIASVEPIRHD